MLMLIYERLVNWLCNGSGWRQNSLLEQCGPSFIVFCWLRSSLSGCRSSHSQETAKNPVVQSNGYTWRMKYVSIKSESFRNTFPRWINHRWAHKKCLFEQDQATTILVTAAHQQSFTLDTWKNLIRIFIFEINAKNKQLLQTQFSRKCVILPQNIILNFWLPSLFATIYII